MIAEGYEHQKGGIFGFGKKKYTDTNVNKMCDMSEKQLKMMKMSKCTIWEKKEM